MTSYLDAEPSPVIARTDFPAVVTLPDGTVLPLARVTITAGWVHVHTAPGEPAFSSPRHGPLTLRSVYDPPTVPSSTGTDAGGLSWIGAAGCGCSHPLKRWRPFTGGPQRLGPTAG